MTTKLIIDALLTLGFGVQHSIIAALGIKKLVAKYFNLDSMQWRSVQSFINVNYILIAASLWQSTDYVVYEVTGNAAIVMCVFLLIGWIWYFESHLFEYDCGQAFGCSAIIAKTFGLDKPVPEMWNVLGRKWIRFPVHTAFFPMFLCFPRMTADLLVFGIVINMGNIYGTILYDKRLIKLVGQPYLEYIKRTNLLSPFMFGAKRKGSADMVFPKPIMFEKPLIYTDAVIIGMILGYFNFILFGSNVVNEFTSLYSIAVFSVICAVGAGLLLGALNIGSLGKYLIDGQTKNFLTLLGTKSAFVSAVNMVIYFGLTFYYKGSIAPFTIILPLWLIVLWLTNFMSASVIIAVSRRRTLVKTNLN